MTTLRDRTLVAGPALRRQAIARTREEIEHPHAVWRIDGHWARNASRIQVADCTKNTIRREARPRLATLLRIDQEANEIEWADRWIHDTLAHVALPERAAS